MRATQPLIKIMDFGLARLADASNPTHPNRHDAGHRHLHIPRTDCGRTLGPPLRCLGLGVVMYQMVSGCAPFEGKYLSAIAYSIMNERHESLSALAVDVPEDLARIVDKALEKSPDDRYQHLDEMLADLAAVERTPAPELPTAEVQVPVLNLWSTNLKYALVGVALIALAAVSFTVLGDGRQIPAYQE